MAGVLEDAAGRVLVAQRPAGKSLAGSWEFPGGKLDPGEDRLAGLARELEEELGIRVRPHAARPLLRYLHRYPELEIELDAWRVPAWDGEPHGLEGQAIAWRAAGDAAGDRAVAGRRGDRHRHTAAVHVRRHPARGGGRRGGFSRRARGRGAGRPGRADLPATPGPRCKCPARARRGGGLPRRGHGRAPAAAWRSCRARSRARRAAARTGRASAGTVAGLHVPGRYLGALRARPVPETFWFGASCHDAAQLEAAHALHADYAFLGPVQATASHPGEPGIGWDGFAKLVAELPLPVYAIGGLGPADLETAWAAGAQGIAAIRSLWPG
jgi:8-oxo-dGTP diphosphatase